MSPTVELSPKIVKETGYRFVTNISDDDLELYQYAIIGFDPQINTYDKSGPNPSAKYTLWSLQNGLSLFWERFKRMKAAKESGNEDWRHIK